jgi:hypothetical protein
MRGVRFIAPNAARVRRNGHVPEYATQGEAPERSRGRAATDLVFPLQNGRGSGLRSLLLWIFYIFRGADFSKTYSLNGI